MGLLRTSTGFLMASGKSLLPAITTGPLNFKVTPGSVSFIENGGPLTRVRLQAGYAWSCETVDTGDGAFAWGDPSSGPPQNADIFILCPVNYAPNNRSCMIRFRDNIGVVINFYVYQYAAGK